MIRGEDNDDGNNKLASNNDDMQDQILENKAFSPKQTYDQSFQTAVQNNEIPITQYNDNDNEDDAADSETATIEAPPLEIDEIVKLKLNFSNLCQVFQQSLAHIQSIKGQEIVVAIGFTGSGKSTLLSALIDGAKSLQGTKNEKNKLLIDTKNDSSTFKIGHKVAKSETFLPTAAVDPNHDQPLFYVDIAGQDDNRSELIDILNGLITKTIFK